MLCDLLNVAAKYSRDHPRQFWTVNGALLLAGLLEGVGFTAVLPALQLLLNQGGTAAGDSSPLVRWLEYGLATMQVRATLENLLVVLVTAFALKAVTLYLAMRVVSTAVANINAAFRSRLIDAIAAAKWAYFSDTKIGTVANALTIEGNAAANAYWTFSNIVTQTISIIVYLAIATTLSPSITIGSLVAGALLILALRGIVRRSKQASASAVEAYNTLSAAIVDGLTGFKPVKVMALEDRFERILSTASNKLREAQRRIVLNKETLTIAQEFITISLSIVVVYFLVGGGVSSIDEVILLAILFQRSVSKVGRIQSFLNRLAVSEVHRISLEGKIDQATLFREEPVVGEPVNFSRDIQVDGVSFRHGDQPILKNVSIRIPFGSVTVISGPSGSGKTTLTDLIASLRTPASGRILIDGSPLDEIDTISWRRSIGYVQQEHFLFQDSIYNNVTLSDEEVPHSDVEEAITHAGAQDFVNKLPARLETNVGTGGAILSGGQRQRIMLARALVRKPRLLILDEPTTALDPVTEREICQTLRGLTGEVTILVVSHQEALKDIADQLIEVRDGKIIASEERTPPDLRAKA
jgi:ATP-binding cassette subfamily C protein